MDLAVAILVQAVNWPLVALLVWRAARGRIPAVAGATVIVFVAASAVSVWDPTVESDLSRAAVAVVNASIAMLFAVYPDGRLVPRWIAVPAVLEVAIQTGNVASGFAWEDVQPWWPAHFAVTWGALLLGGQLYRYARRSSVDERERTRWPLLGLIAMIFGFTLWCIGWGAGAIPFDATWFANLLLAIPAPAFALGMLAPRSLPIDRLLRVVIAAGLWLTTVALVAWGVFGALQLWVGGAAAAWFAAMIAALVGLAAAIGARWSADRVVLGHRPDPLRTLVDLGDRLSAAIDPRAVPAEVVATVTDALGLRHAALSSPGGLSAASGIAPEADAAGVASFPIAYAGEDLGALTVSPRPGDAALAADDRAALSRICTQAAPALHSARVVAELIEARSRVVFAREEERRRLRRDLHDDLAPTFAGLGLAAAAVETFSRAGDVRASDAAARLVTGLHAATRQLREIAYDLRPPVLDDRGLVAAIEERILAPGSVPIVRVDAPRERLRLPAAIESAALRIVQEAVANARRHAAASVCVVTIRQDEGMLRIEVADDGVGIASRRATTPGGVGLRSMRERAAEVGGGLELGDAAGGGTLVVADLPVMGGADASAPISVSAEAGR